MPEYELIKVIGQGGMGSVYEGRSGDGKRVAIKMMNSTTSKGQWGIGQYNGRDCRVFYYSWFAF